MASGKTSAPPPKAQRDEISFFIAILTYINFATLIILGHIRDLVARLLHPFGVHAWGQEIPIPGYGTLTDEVESFFARRIYRRSRDVFARPVASSPGAWIDIMERTSDDYGRTFTIKKRVAHHALNLGSYNYLGFGEYSEAVTEPVVECMNKCGVSTASPAAELGTMDVHHELERSVARYLGKPAAFVYGMGFATNSLSIPSLVGKGCLIISDTFNHASIVVGGRGSGAKIAVFAHDDPVDLERVLRKAISEGQPRTHRPWRKILIIVEGVYSMEGEVCRLKEIVEVKKKYKAYLYIDEAHSIGAMGKTGRGVVEHCGVDSADVDVMMGTFTKSFASAGGYVAANQEVVDHIRSVSAGSAYAISIPPGVAMQIIQSLRVISGEDGTDLGARKIAQLHDNANYMRREMKKMGLHVLGEEDSPVVPMMIYMPGKIREFSVRLLERNVAIVVVGFPACALSLSRARFCVSAGHTREDIDYGLAQIAEVTEMLQLRYNSPSRSVWSSVSGFLR